MFVRRDVMENSHCLAWKRKRLWKLVGNILIIYQILLSRYLTSLGSVLTESNNNAKNMQQNGYSRQGSRTKDSYLGCMKNSKVSTHKNTCIQVD